MLEWIVMGGFIALLFASVALGVPLLAALLAGYGLFFLYGLLRGHKPKALWRMSLEGVKTVRNILFLFLLIGMITALWRASGTIPFLIYYAAGLISPKVFLLLAFLICSFMSFLTGTSFGTAATVGTICMAMAATMGISPALAGGAALAGAFFGDRSSPMSTSALLVAALTETDIYANLKGMFRRAAVPFVFTAAVYLALGFLLSGGEFSQDLVAPFAAGFHLHWLTVLPAVLIVVLSLFRCPVKITMGVSIGASAVLCVFLQDVPLPELVRMAVLGYSSTSPDLQELLAGGGLLSMLRPLCIVCITSTFSGLFNGTGMLEGVKAVTFRLAERVTAFGSLLAVSVVTCLIACNQTLAIMLSHALCRDQWEKEGMALALEDTAVMIAPLVPWSIAGAVPLAAMNAPTVSLLAACYLYLIPLWGLFRALWDRSQKKIDHQGQGDGAEDGAEEVHL